MTHKEKFVEPFLNYNVRKHCIQKISKFFKMNQRVLNKSLSTNKITKRNIIHYIPPPFFNNGKNNKSDNEEKINYGVNDEKILKGSFIRALLEFDA